MINIEILKNISERDMDNILEVWESAVRATHDFLSEEDIISLIPEVKKGINYVSDLVCLRDNNNLIQGFMGVHDNKIEMLFVNNSYRGKGLGKRLIIYAIETLDIKYVDVNEQNTQGVGFYKHMGFDIFKISKFDEQGNPFPILHMKLS